MLKLIISLLLAAPALAASEYRGGFRLSIDPETQLVSDSVGGRKVEVTGGTIVPDERFGASLSFGSGNDNAIVVADSPPLDFSQGFTFEAMLKFETDNTAEINGGLFGKFGTGWTSFKNGKAGIEWLLFPREKVFASEKDHFDYYPVNSYLLGGRRQVPLKQWVQVAITYDPVRKTIRTWMDGGVDRVSHVADEGEMPLQSNGSAITLFKGLKNFQVAEVKISGRQEAFTALPAMEVFVHQLPWAPKPQAGLLIDHIDPALTFPVEVAVYWQDLVGHSSIIKRMVLDGSSRRTEFVDLPGFPNAPYTMIVQAYSENREIFRKEFPVTNPRAKADGRVRIGQDHSISVSGKKIFPLFIYRIPPEDFKSAKEMGFNIVGSRSWNAPSIHAHRFTAEAEAAIARNFAAADEAGVLLSQEWLGAEGATRFRKEKSLFGWYLADEPWGLSLESLRHDYNTAMLIDPSIPTWIAQADVNRFAETAELTDIIACDPYPFPNVPFRYIIDATRKAVRGSGGFMPVWTILGQYETKIPSLEQLRCMVWLAIVSGANGIGIYAWDDRALDPSTGDRTVHPKTGSRGWYLPEHPREYENLKSVISELAALQEVLVVPNDPAVGAGASDNKDVVVALKRAAGGEHILVANASRKAETARISLPNGSGEGNEIFRKAAALTVTDGQASIELPAYGVAVYRFAKGTFKK